MISLSTPPPNFLIFNARGDKNLVIVVDIPGLDLLTTTNAIITSGFGRAIQYGDPITYGEAGITYGGALPSSVTRKVRPLISLEGGSFTISQKLEPEQGRGSISTINMTFIDKDQYMSQAVASGTIIPEILGKSVKIWIGYLETTYPNDYFVVWRGRVGQVNMDIGKCNIQFVDPNVARRQNVFYSAQTTLASAVGIGDSTINVTSNGNFHQKIVGPGGVYDTNVKTFIKIDDEFIEYQQAGSEGTGFGTNQFVGVLRGQNPIFPQNLSNGSQTGAAATHSPGATVDSYLQLTGHPMDMALKIMLSGWNGPFLMNQQVSAFVTTGDPSNPSITNGIVLPTNTDAIRDLGISVGDTFTTTGDANAGNNTTGTVIGFNDVSGMSNNAILTSVTFTASSPSSAQLSIRSQFDVWPVSCGVRMPGYEVDVGQFQFYKNTFLSNPDNAYRFLISSDEAAKTFIENQLFLPIGAYSLTRQGKCSVGITKPPIADQRTQTLNISNVIDPQVIQVQRGVNNRKFFNEIDWTFDYDETDAQTSTRKGLDSTSLNVIGVLSVLPITAKGARTDLGFQVVAAGRESLLLNRYSRGSVILNNVKTNLGVGNQVEVGDELVLMDNGQLQILNFTTGQRNFGTQLVEVIGRNVDLIAGVTTLTLEGNTGALVTDRFATISPSSVLDSGNTPTRIVITNSFGQVFPGQEWKKWNQYVGLNVRVHTIDYVTDATTTFTGFDPTNQFAMLLSPALPFTPAPGYIVDITQYPNDTNVSNQALFKLIHCFLDPSPHIVSGIDQMNFTVSVGDAVKFIVGNPVTVHNINFSALSPEVKVSAVVGTTITVSAPLGFIPDNTMQAELLGFLDGGFPYRLI